MLLYEEFLSEKTLTLPNVLTLGRLAAGFYLPQRFGQDPKGWWPATLAVGATDMADGWIADHFNQRSRLGRILDPVADKFFWTRTIWEGRNTIVPKWLAVLALGQRALTASAGIRAQARGIEMSASPLGRAGELMGDLGIVALAACEAINDSRKRKIGRIVATITALTGIATSLKAAKEYHEGINNEIRVER